MYSVAARRERLTVEAAYLHELRDGSRRAVDISEPLTRQAADSFRGRLAAVRRGKFAAQPDADRCNTCEYNAICRHAARDSRKTC